jgi:S1-C subfamily serine protease
MSTRPMSPRPSIPIVAAAVVAIAAIGAGGAATYAVLGPDSTRTVVREVTAPGSPDSVAASPGGLSIGEIYRRAHPGVVEITVAGASFDESSGQRAQGSGFVYDADGHVVTNQHVVGEAESISVRFASGATHSAKLVGSDASTDIAVIKVDAPRSVFKPIALGSSSALAVGDAVVAIGSPFGLEGTITSGIVSALHRQMTAPNGFSINDSIQTDAPINHGNSGGPLLDARGRVVGVNAQIRSDSGGNEGVGFAIPSDTVRSIVTQLLETGKAEHAFLGISVDTIPASVASELGVPAGVAVTEVRADTPASQAGLRAATDVRTVDAQSYPTGGDVITAIDGRKITSAAELQSAIDARRPGERVTITYSRDGESRTARITLVTRPS